MKTYLRIINPLVAALVLALCFWAVSFDKGQFKPIAIIKGGIPTYVIANGIVLQFRSAGRANSSHHGQHGEDAAGLVFGMSAVELYL